jgi:two-component system, LytTR family, sensor kinase
MLYSISNSQNNPVHEFLTNKKWSFLKHFILIFIVVVNFELFYIQSIKEFAKFCRIPFEAMYIGNLVSAIFSIILIYVNVYYLFPKFLKKGLYLKYAIGLFVLLFLLFFMVLFIDSIYIDKFYKDESITLPFSGKGFVQTMTYPFVFLGATTGYKFFKTWIEDQNNFANLQQEKLKSELNQLKNQVNPHFLFNTLNNLHVLIKTNPEKASNITLGLSDVLRYQIYYSQHDEIILLKEIDWIIQYLELEKIRRDNLKFNIKIEGNTSVSLVPPLLFINFIENAIKHSNTREEANIDILFKVENNKLYFEIENTKSVTNVNDKKGGFGLTNVQKRLDLLFSNTYELAITEEEKLFTVKLNFPI